MAALTLLAALLDEELALFFELAPPAAAVAHDVVIVLSSSPPSSSAFDLEIFLSAFDGVETAAAALALVPATIAAAVKAGVTVEARATLDGGPAATPGVFGAAAAGVVTVGTAFAVATFDTVVAAGEAFASAGCGLPIAPMPMIEAT